MRIDTERIQMDYSSVKNYCLKHGFKVPGNMHKLFKKASYRWGVNTQSQRLREALFLDGYLIPENSKDKAYLLSLKARLERKELKIKNKEKKDGAVTELF